MLKKVWLFILIYSIWLSGLPVMAQTNRQMEREKASTNTTEKRLALVIGNGAYQNAAALSNPVNDATDMAATLKDLNFEVISGTNQTKQQMEKLIRDFGNRLAETKAVGLFFYAGHGIAAGGTNYLIPVDADIQAEDEIEYSSVSINFVLGKMAAANNGFNMVILDACRNNPFARKWRNYRDTGNSGGLTRIDAPTGTLIAYATKPGDVASDGTGRNGLYTGALLKQMRVKNVDITKMFQYVRADVLKQSGGKQVPFDESSVVGDFYFGGFDQSVVTQNSVNSSTNSKTGEETFWKTIENSTDERDFENYIARSERGEFTGTYKASAELKLFRLKKAKVADVWTKLSGMAKTLLKYNYVGLFSEGLAEVCIGNDETNKCGFIDRSGKEVIPLKYNLYSSSISKGVALVCIDVANRSGATNAESKCGLIDKTGKEITPLEYEYRGFVFSEGLASVCEFETTKCSFINEIGQEVFPMKYSDTGIFSEGLAKICIGESPNKKCGFIDKTGKEVISLPLPLKYFIIHNFSEGLAQACIGDWEKAQCGFIDTKGKEVIPLKYTMGLNTGTFSEGLASVCKGDGTAQKCGFIDKTGKEIIPLKYDHVNDFSGGLSVVCADNYGTRKCGFIDKTGKEFTLLKYTLFNGFSEGLNLVGIGDYEKGKWGIIDSTGKEITPLKYERIWSKVFSKEGFIGVVLDGKKGFLDIYGKEYFDF